MRGAQIMPKDTLYVDIDDTLIVCAHKANGF